MSGQEIRVDIAEDGTVKIEAIGYEGPACTAATAALEKALGITGTGRKLKPEYQRRAAAQTVKVGR